MPSPPQKHIIFNAVAIAIASPEDILAWSHGEIQKPETINYRTQKPERDGLFCEKIFGPTKNWECYCGKYRRIRYKGVICEKCGVEVTRSIVRRDRMGHIKLAAPVTHIWFLRSTPSRIGLLLDLPIKTIEQVVYFAAYIVTQLDEKAKEEAILQLKNEHKIYKDQIRKEFKERMTILKKEDKPKKAINDFEKESAFKVEELDEQFSSAKDELDSLKIGRVLSELDYRDMSMKFGHVFKANTGAEAIQEIIQNIDLKKTIIDLQDELSKTSGQKQKKIIKRIKLAGSLVKANIKPEWMILSVLPVIPPDLRPMVQLDGGRFAASDLNDLYRRVINRNNRLKKLITIGAPEVICRNEKRMLQEAVDTLLNNSARQGKTVFNSGDKRKLRSLSDMLKGKQGRFRQNLLGKRVDYSGRSVIVIGPKLKLNQCGIPKEMALELFKPHVIGRLIKDGYAHNIKSAEKLLHTGRREIWDILEETTKTSYVLLNRAPTLHRLGIQAFQPILIEGKAIQIHPLVCAAFNADFDGDQMAVHVPLSKPAQNEARDIILSSQNLLKPSAGEPIIVPTQDMVLGCYYLTVLQKGLTGEGSAFSSINEAIIANQLDYIHLQAIIKVKIDDEIIETSIGRLIFNQLLPKDLGFYNQTMDKKSLKNIFNDCFTICGKEATAEIADKIKKIGFEYATKSGLSIAAIDIAIPPSKDKIIEKADDTIKQINNLYWKGFVTDHERYLQTIHTWQEAKSKITVEMIAGITKDPNSDIAYMINSGARGNWGQITQLCGIKGLVANPAGRTIELPIKSNLKEGFTILEYFIATHGGRKGKSDTALKTAEAGYLTRRLVDATQDVIIRENDCGSTHVHRVTQKESKKIGEAFENRIFGRVLAELLIHPKTKKKIAGKNKEIDHNLIKEIQAAEIEEINVRSVMTCQTSGGICQKCYGRDLGTNQTVKIGTAVGIIAAQSIGEPGTQLTMRTFHMGGVAEEQEDITQGLTRVEELFEARPPKSAAVLSEIQGVAKVSKKPNYTEITISSNKPIEKTYELPFDFTPCVKPKEKIKEKQIIARHPNSKKTLRAEEDCTVLKTTKHFIIIKTSSGVTQTYRVPSNRTLRVKTGTLIAKGEVLTAGHINLKDLLKLSDIYTVQKYIMSEVQSIYSSQGQTINDKHIEIIVRQMLSKARIIDPGDTNSLPGEVINYYNCIEENKKLIKKKKQPVHLERLLLGLTRVALHTDSWLSAASFQETIRVLVEASTTHRIDRLEGLKENVIIGKLIPAGETYINRQKNN